jgi:hypothetical protein
MALEYSDLTIEAGGASGSSTHETIRRDFTLVSEQISD